jgi:hypothetical protein
MAVSRPYSVRAMSVATWSFTSETWGTPSSVTNIQTVTFGPEHDTDMLKILGANEASLAILTHAVLGASFGGIDWDTMAIMAGMADESSGASPHINDLVGGGSGLPYFGAAFAIAMENGADFHVYAPLCQLTSYPPLDFEQNQFARPQIDINALRLRLADNSVYAVMRWKTFNTETALPTNFNSDFAALVQS